MLPSCMDIDKVHVQNIKIFTAYQLSYHVCRIVLIKLDRTS